MPVTPSDGEMYCYILLTFLAIIVFPVPCLVLAVIILFAACFGPSRS